MVRYTPAPRTAPQIRLGQIPKGYLGTRASVEQVKALIRAGAKDFYVRQKAIDILLQVGVKAKDYLGEIAALFGWVQRHVRYTKDPYRVEVLHSARRMLELRAGDCDDMAILLGAMLEAIGHPVRLILVGPNLLRPRFFNHVYLEVYYKGGWIPLDATMPHSIGWAPRGLIKMVVSVRKEAGREIREHRSGYLDGTGLAGGPHSRGAARGAAAERCPCQNTLGRVAAANSAGAEPLVAGRTAPVLGNGAEGGPSSEDHGTNRSAAAGLGRPARGPRTRRGTHGATSPLETDHRLPGAENAAQANRQPTTPALTRAFTQAAALYRSVNKHPVSRVLRTQHPRTIPPIVVELGQLLGLIYRSDRGQRGRPRNYIHLMENPPSLASDVKGKQLYILGGRYQVTDRGIEG